MIDDTRSPGTPDDPGSEHGKRKPPPSRSRKEWSTSRRCGRNRPKPRSVANGSSARVAIDRAAIRVSKIRHYWLPSPRLYGLRRI